MKHTFNISMDNEAKKAGDIRKVELEVSFEGVPDETIRKHAMANMTVAWQNQIRGNWTAFDEGKLPNEITFGEPLFATRRAAPMTPESAKAFIEAMSPEAREALLKSLNA